MNLPFVEMDKKEMEKRGGKYKVEKWEKCENHI
jgi:hypothetical protein